MGVERGGGGDEDSGCGDCCETSGEMGGGFEGESKGRTDVEGNLAGELVKSCTQRSPAPSG